MADQGTTAQAKDKAQELAGQAQEQAQQAAGQARERVRGEIDRRSTQAGDRVSGQAGDLRSVGEQLREQGKEQPAKLADQAADRLEQAGTWLTESDADRILGDVEDFARRNPWAVMAGGVALGFVASRMLKASSTERSRTRDGAVSGQRSLTATVGTGGERFRRAEPPATTVPAPPAMPAPPIVGQTGAG